MQKSNAPTKLTVAFASGTGAGPVNTVPLTPGATAGTASYQTGFTSVNMEPTASGGIPPFGADFNGLFQAATTAQIWQQSGYMWPFDSTFAANANIGGYPAGSVLMMGSGKGLWLNQADNNEQSPDVAGSSGWIGLPAAGSYTINTTGGTTTPDPSVLGVTTLLVTGALTSNAILVLPLTAGARWIIQNNTTGSYTLTVQGATGTGVSISQGSALTVFTDGTNYFAASANISGQYLPIDGTAVAATKLATARNFSITGLATAAAISFDGTGNVTFNVTALNVAGALGYTPANDADVVHLDGSETITGSKVFSGAAPQSTGAGAGWQFNDRTESSPTIWTWYATGGQASLYNTNINNNVAAITESGAWTLPFLTVNDNGSGSTSQLVVTGTGANGANLQLAGPGATTPNKTIRAIGGILQIINSAYSAPILQLDDSGNLSGINALTCTTINASSSDRRLKRDIHKFTPRPLHRSVRFVSYTLKANGWHGLGSVAQDYEHVAPEHVGTFDKDGKTYLSLNYAGAAYEQAMWAGQEIDRLLKRIEKLERSRLPRKAGFLKRLREILW